MSEELILGALARGYCTPRNEHKELDAYLIEDMCAEIEKIKVSRLEKDGMPSFYISLSELPCCTHRMAESDIPVWCASGNDALKAMDFFNNHFKC